MTKEMSKNDNFPTTSRYSEFSFAAKNTCDQLMDHQFQMMIWEKKTNDRMLHWETTQEDNGVCSVLTVYISGEMVYQLSGWGKDEQDAKRDASKKCYFKVVQ